MLLVPVMVVKAQQYVSDKNDRLLVVLNGGISMGEEWEKGNSRFDIAADVITTLMKEAYKVNKDVEFGLWVYGHQYKPSLNRCNDARREVFFSKDNMGQIALRLKDIRPKGNGSIENAVTAAIESDIIDTHLYRYSIIVITDSNKSCPDNICIPLNRLGKSGGVYKRYYINMAGVEKKSTNYTCFDYVFPAVNDYSIDTCIVQIVKDIKRKSPKYTWGGYQSKPKTVNKEIVIPVRPKTSAIVKNIDTPVVKAQENILKTPSKAPGETVKIRKQSRIKSEIDEFGYLKLNNTTLVSRIIIYRLTDDNYEQTNEVYPVGMHDVKVKLKTGSYKMLFNVSGLAEGARTFEIKNDTVTEIWFR